MRLSAHDEEKTFILLYDDGNISAIGVKNLLRRTMRRIVPVLLIRSTCR